MRAKIQTPKKTILIYGLEETQFQALAEAAKAEDILCYAVTDTQTTFTVARLLYDRPETEAEAQPIDGKFALLDGFGNHPEAALRLINAVDISVIKAVHTPHNGAWKFKDLCEAILKEHQMMQEK